MAGEAGWQLKSCWERGLREGLTCVTGGSLARPAEGRWCDGRCGGPGQEDRCKMCVRTCARQCAHGQLVSELAGVGLRSAGLQVTPCIIIRRWCQQSTKGANKGL